VETGNRRPERERGERRVERLEETPEPEPNGLNRARVIAPLLKESVGR